MISSWEHQILIKGLTVEGSVEFYVLFKITQQEEIIQWKPRLERAWEGRAGLLHVSVWIQDKTRNRVFAAHGDRESSDWILVEKTRMGSRHWKAVRWFLLFFCRNNQTQSFGWIVMLLQLTTPESEFSG